MDNCTPITQQEKGSVNRLKEDAGFAVYDPAKNVKPTNASMYPGWLDLGFISCKESIRATFFTREIEHSLVERHFILAYFLLSTVLQEKLLSLKESLVKVVCIR